MSALPLNKCVRGSGSSSGGSKGEGGGPQKPATPRQDAMSKTLTALQSVELEQALASLTKPSSSGNLAESAYGAADASSCSKGGQPCLAASLGGEALLASSSSSSEEDLIDFDKFRQPSHHSPGHAFQRLKERRWSATQEGRISAYPDAGQGIRATDAQVIRLQQ